MSDNSKIGWTDASWNPVTGCTEVSPGCERCYAKTFAERWRGIPGHHFENGFDVTLRPERLDQPLRWKKPRRIFVNSMSDLFHADIPDPFIEQVFDVEERATRHVFQNLTKRHARLRSFVRAREQRQQEYAAKFDACPTEAMRNSPAAQWARERAATPPPNIWLGVSTEDQHWADIRIPALLDTPAAVRFLSCEPLLGPINIDPYLWLTGPSTAGPFYDHAGRRRGGGGIGGQALTSIPGRDLHWLIVGGESGPGHRPMDIGWLESIVAQCRDAGVPIFVKQDSGPRAGRQGRIPDGLWIHEFPSVAAKAAA